LPDCKQIWIFSKYFHVCNIKFHGYPYSRRRTDACEHTDGQEVNWRYLATIPRRIKDSWSRRGNFTWEDFRDMWTHGVLKQRYVYSPVTRSYYRNLHLSKAALKMYFLGPSASLFLLLNVKEKSIVRFKNNICIGSFWTQGHHTRL